VPEGQDGGEESRNATEAGLLSQAQAGDQQAFVELCNRHSRRLKGRIFRIVKNQEDAEDIFQETLMRAYRRLNGFRGSCSFQTWITQIAINTALMLLRRRKTSPERSRGLVGKEGEVLDFPEVADSGLNPEQIYSRVQTSVIVSNEVSRLPAGFRPLMDLYYGEESSLGDAAQALGMTVATAKSRLTRARALLRRRLRHHALECI
jgi:RNA polymerase sigma-70 factor (ECF subfamily)